jgi:adenine-specific DNA-methyltransferase
MTTPLEKFQSLLRDLFQFEQADLDFGVYRIMNLRRERMEKWLNEELPARARAILKQGGNTADDDIDSRLEVLKAALLELEPGGVDEDGNITKEFLKESTKGKEYLKLKAQADRAPARTAAGMEPLVYNHLYDFFSRYYDTGDFIPKRRRSFAPDGRDTYAIPWDGEEVVLHWANKDQYYIKTGERFTHYRWQSEAGGRTFTVEFRLTDADLPANNNKDAKKKFNLLVADKVEWQEDTSTLIVPFHYRRLTPEEEGQYTGTQEAKLRESIIKRTVDTLRELPAVAGVPQLATALMAPKRDAAGQEKRNKDGNAVPLLPHHLNRWAVKNESDFFIHKDLRRFLLGELDYFLKSVVLNLDNLLAAGEQRAEPNFRLLEAVKRLGTEIVDFVSQLEDFQKALFEKKKFVLETNYCVSLDRVPETLLPEIARNAAQIAEWKKLFEIDAIAADTTHPGFSEPLTVDFLKAHLHLVIDTAYFPPPFMDKLLDSPEFRGASASVHDATSGLLVVGENLQALKTVASTWTGDFTTFYSDPPFNIGENADFAYKTDYPDSSWMSLLENRIAATAPLLAANGLMFVRCDYHGSHLVRCLLNALGLYFKAEILIDRSRNEAGSPNKIEATYEHLFMFGITDSPIEKFTVQRSLANIKWTGFLMAGDRNPPARVFLGKTIMPPAGQHFSLKQSKVDKLLNDYFLRLKCRDCGCLYFSADDDQSLWRQMKTKTHRFKFYDITTDSTFHGLRQLDLCVECQSGNFKVDYLGSDEVYVNDNWLDISSYSRRWGFLTENSEDLVDRVVQFGKGAVVDLFGGSGTSAAVAMKNNRRWLTCECGSQADEVILPRLKAVLAGEDSGISTVRTWRGRGVFKYVRTESYEDALDNIEFNSGAAPGAELGLDFSRDYELRYALDWESKDCPTRFAVAQLDTPFDYTLTLRRESGTMEVKPDLPETFAYLIGLHTRRRFRTERDGVSYLIYTGTLHADGTEVAVLWRTCKDWMEGNLKAEMDWWREQRETLAPGATRVYVNGASAIEGHHSLDAEFKTRMHGGTV